MGNGTIEVTKKDVNRAKRISDLEEKVRELDKLTHDLLHDMRILNKIIINNKVRHDRRDKEEKDRTKIVIPSRFN